MPSLLVLTVCLCHHPMVIQLLVMSNHQQCSFLLSYRSTCLTFRLHSRNGFIPPCPDALLSLSDKALRGFSSRFDHCHTGLFHRSSIFYKDQRKTHKEEVPPAQYRVRFPVVLLLTLARNSAGLVVRTYLDLASADFYSPSHR